MLGLGRAVIVKKAVGAAGGGLDLGHDLFHDAGHGFVVFVGGFAALEVDVRVLGRAAHVGVLGIHGPGAKLRHLLHVHHLGDIGEFERLDFLHLVRGAEAVEEVQEGQARLNGGQVGDKRHVVRFLDRTAAQDGESGLAAGHDVLLVAEDGQRVRGHGAGGHMEDAGQKLAGDLVHVGDHEEQALGGREGAGERAARQTAVHRSGGSGFGLHLADVQRLAEDVFHAMRGPFVHHFAHGGGRRDGEKRRAFGEGVGHPGGGGVAVHGHFELCCHCCFPCLELPDV